MESVELMRSEFPFLSAAPPKPPDRTPATPLLPLEPPDPPDPPDPSTRKLCSSLESKKSRAPPEDFSSQNDRSFPESRRLSLHVSYPVGLHTGSRCLRREVVSGHPLSPSFESMEASSCKPSPVPPPSRRLHYSLNLRVLFAMTIAVAGDPLSKLPELFLDVPPSPGLQLVARTLGCRVVCLKPNSLPLQARQVCYVSDPASTNLEDYRIITDCVALLGSPYLSMRLPLPQYEDVTIWCCEPLNCFPVEGTSSSLGDINLSAGWFHIQDSSGSFVSHISSNGRLLAPDVVAGKLALSTALLEAAFAGLIASDVLFDSQSLNPPLISKDVANYLYEIRCLSVEYNCICFAFVSCSTMVMVWFVVNNFSFDGA